MPPNLTRDQLRARHALERIDTVKALSRKVQSTYNAAAKSLPANIVMNGLGQACAMLLAQAGRQEPIGKNGESGHQLLYNHLQDWLCHSDQSVYSNQKDLIEEIIGNGQREYVRAQVEALAYLDWLKKFAQAYLAEAEDRDGQAH